MSKLTKEAWLAQIEACGGEMSQDQVINLVFKDGPSALWSETVNQMHVMYDGMYNYLTGLFPTRQWGDWKGTTELGQVYHSPYLPIDMSIFQRSMQVCDPMNADECHTDYCEIPRGGITNLPELEMYKTGFKTEPMCIANIRTSEQAKQIATMIVNERFAVDQQVMNTFYTMALIRMLGHKFVLEYRQDGADVIPVDSNNPYNPVQGFRYHYMQPLFPAVGDLNNVMPLDFSVLDMFGRAFATSRNNNYIARGPRGEPIYEMWHAEDWYRQEMLDNKEWVDRVKYLMKTELLPGYRMAGAEQTEKEIIGNFSLRQNDALPRFAESVHGGLAIVQTTKPVAVDIGTRPVHSYREYENAPFLMSAIIGKNVGEILTRPTLSTGIEGRPIQPISGTGEWIYRNDFSECNDDLNKPHFRKRYEMGFRMLNPDAGYGFIHRAKKFRLRPVQTCDLRPIYKITPAKIAPNCDVLTVGCNPNNLIMDNNILDDVANQRKIKCSSKVCGDSTSTIYRVEVRRESIDAISPDQNPLQDCACGDTVNVFIGDEDGDTVKVREATILDYYRPNVVNPNPIFIVQLASALAAGECLQYIGCQDDTPEEATVVSCTDSSEDESLESDQVRFLMDSAPDVINVGSIVTITYYDADGVSLGTVDGTVVSINPDTMTYVISSEEEDFGCDMFEGQVTVKVTLAA